MVLLLHRGRPGIRRTITDKLRNWIKQFTPSAYNRNITFILFLNFGFTCFEMFFSQWNFSLGIMAHSLHMLLDCISLLVETLVYEITRWRPNERFSYGYYRAEVIACFGVALFLLYLVLLHVLIPAVKRLMYQIPIIPDYLIWTSVLRLVVKILNIYMFHLLYDYNIRFDDDEHAHGTSGPGINVKMATHKFQITKTVIIQIFVDTLESMGLLVSAIMIEVFGSMTADPLSAIFIGVYMIVDMLPMLKESTAILAQRQPKALDHILPKCYDRVLQLPGVQSIQETHFWTLNSMINVGTLKVTITRTVDPTDVIQETERIFYEAGVAEITIQLDYPLM